MPSIGKGQCWLSVEDKSRDCWILHTSSLPQCLVLSCHQFLYQFEFISWGSCIPPRCLVFEAHNKGLWLGGDGIRAGQRRGLNNIQVALAPEQGHSETQNNELGQGVLGGAVPLIVHWPQLQLVEVAPIHHQKGTSQPKPFWMLREVKKLSITVQTIHNNRS